MQNGWILYSIGNQGALLFSTYNHYVSLNRIVREELSMVNFNLKELLTLPTKIIASLAIATGLILFLPKNILNLLYLEAFNNKYGFIIGITFTISLAILISTMCIVVVKLFFYRYQNKKMIKNGEKYLQTLNGFEKSIIEELYNKPDNTLELPINKGIVKTLEYHNVIGKITNQNLVYGDSSEWAFPYLLQPWVFDYVRKHPHYFKN